MMGDTLAVIAGSVGLVIEKSPQALTDEGFDGAGEI
jgi:hypothetical protein